MTERALGDDPAPLLLGRLAALLVQDRHDLAGALALLREGIGARGLALLDAGGAPLAVAGEVVRLAGGRPAPHVSLPGGGQLTAPGAPPAALALLQAAAGVLALALATPPAAPAELLLAEQATALADALHDGPLQALVAARWTADAGVRCGDPAPARDAVQHALVALRRALWQARARGLDAGGLPDALRALSEQRTTAGTAPLALALDAEACQRLDPAARALAYRLVQALAGPDAVSVSARRVEADLLLTVEGAAPLERPDSWRARARALGGVLHLDAAATARLLLPCTPTPSRPDPRTAP